MQIEFRETVEIPVNDIKLDPKNPNVMTKEQEEGLKYSFAKWGFLQPCVVDQNNLLCDGEHRLAIFKENGWKKIPCYIIKFENDGERRLLRQVLNKLHGQHDPLLDIEELEIIMKSHEEDLKDLLQLTKDDLEKQNEYAKALANDQFFKKRSNEDEEVLDQLRNKTGIENAINATGDEGFNINKIVLEFAEDEEYEECLKLAKEVMKKYNLTNHKDLYLELLRDKF